MHLCLMLIGLSLLLSACGHVPKSPEPTDTSVGNGAAEVVVPDPRGTDQQESGQHASVQQSGGWGRDSFWPHGERGDTLAIFPPLSAAERLRMGSEYRPGAVHTYVLYGVGDGQGSQQTRPWGHTELELLRLIDTYVISTGVISTGEVSSHGESSTRHEFLIPVYAGLESLPLTERSAPELADAAREALAAWLAQRQHLALADRLRSAPGPFLISRTVFDLVPAQDSDVLLTDLSNMGPEYLYPVVDAYDRRVSEAAAEADAALVELRQRLARLGHSSGNHGDEQWLYLLESATGQATIGAKSKHGG
ncbi:hypothetical protein Thiowin_01660 [Thiorhodovibrio winogradskyi]|uniref:Lipoprotein n=1 Tax=Thiorhodovibrio winogradskyi TaxID=77007 RepID=A0ABZ0S9D7_9GAMM|nr:hypothetical protein [Thiorhodovibrio winogradskyi]